MGLLEDSGSNVKRFRELQRTVLLGLAYSRCRVLEPELVRVLEGLRLTLCMGPQEDFWSNVGRYGSYFFSVLLGTAYTAVRPIGGLLRKPVTAVATLAALAALAIFVTTTVSAMLGLNGGYEYEVCPRPLVCGCRGPVFRGASFRSIWLV